MRCCVVNLFLFFAALGVPGTVNCCISRVPPKSGAGTAKNGVHLVHIMFDFILPRIAPRAVATYSM